MINRNCPLVIKDLYLYDFKSAFPTILSKIDWDFGDVDLENKEERNIAIGISQRDNKNLTSFLNNSVDSLLNYYLQENGVKKSEIIVTQKDGFILTKPLTSVDQFIKLDLRKVIEFIIISPDRKRYLISFGNSVEVKGVPNKYSELDTVYKKFSKLNFYNKRNLFSQLDNIKKLVLHNKNKKFYMVEINDRYIIQTIKHGQLEVKNTDHFSLDDIDSKRYYNHYFRPFLNSVFLQFY